jgi:hypothetical protein
MAHWCEENAVNWMVQKTNWLGLALRIKNEAAYAFLLLLLAVPVTVLGSRLGSDGLLHTSKWITVAVAVLELAVAVTGSSFTYKVRQYWAQRWKGTSDSYAQLLHHSLRRAMSLALSTWLLAISTLCLPLVMDWMTRVPEMGLLFVPYILLLGMQWFNTRSYSELAMTVATSGYTPATACERV